MVKHQGHSPLYEIPPFFPLLGQALYSRQQTGQVLSLYRTVGWFNHDRGSLLRCFGMLFSKPTGTYFRVINGLL
jgi:hypothetical protein